MVEDKLKLKLKQHLESYNPARYKVNVGNCLALMEWSWKEAQKELLEEFNKELSKTTNDNEELSAIARVLNKYRDTNN